MKIFSQITTLLLIFGIGILLFTQHIMFSSANRPLTHKVEFDDDKVLYGQLMHDTYVPGKVHSQDDPLAGYVVIKLDDHLNSIDSIKIPASMCRVVGVAYNRNLRADTLDIALKELVCDVNGVIESHKIDTKLIGLKAKSIPATVAMKEKLEVMKNSLHDSDKRVAMISKYYIKEIEDAPPFLVLSANTLIHSSHFLKTR
jgi:hypothetical protein